VRRLVGVVLDGEQVVAEPVGKAGGLEHALRIAGVRDQEIPELEVVAVVGRRTQPFREVRV
jgi:hypothetical protein